MNSICCRDLKVAYNGTDVISNLNLEVPSGTWTTVIGPNGAGKSSLMHAILGLVPSTGSVEISGYEVSDLPLLSTFEPFSEPSSRVFENIIPIGVMNEGTYWPDWARIAAFSDEMIIGPYKGRRTVEIRVYIWDSDNIPNFVHLS